MEFRHAAEIWADFPELAAGAAFAAGIDASARVTDRVMHWYARADSRLAGTPAAELPEIRAWRRAFARMGLKPTQYRCASESLLRRYQKEHVLPAIHPLGRSVQGDLVLYQPGEAWLYDTCSVLQGG